MNGREELQKRRRTENSDVKSYEEFWWAQSKLIEDKDTKQCLRWRPYGSTQESSDWWNKTGKHEGNVFQTSQDHYIQRYVVDELT